MGRAASRPEDYNQVVPLNSDNCYVEEPEMRSIALLSLVIILPGIAHADLNSFTPGPVIEDYDSLNARAVNNALAQLTRLQLVQTLRYENEHKARKTVVQAIEKAIARIDTLPTPEALRAAAA